jgi:hypothetical protein
MTFRSQCYLTVAILMTFISAVVLEIYEVECEASELVMSGLSRFGEDGSLWTYAWHLP